MYVNSVHLQVVLSSLFYMYERIQQITEKTFRILKRNLMEKLTIRWGNQYTRAMKVIQEEKERNKLKNKLKRQSNQKASMESIRNKLKGEVIRQKELGNYYMVIKNNVND